MTMSRIVRPLVAAALLATTLMLARPAAADTLNAYVCAVEVFPNLGGGYGDHGHVQVYSSTNEDCTGAIRFTYFCSENATNSSCTSLSSFHLTERLMVAVFDAAQRAMNLGMQVRIYTDSGATYRGRYLRFFR